MSTLDFLRARRDRIAQEHPRTVSGQFAKQAAIAELERDIRQLEREDQFRIVRSTSFEERL